MPAVKQRLPFNTLQTKVIDALRADTTLLAITKRAGRRSVFDHVPPEEEFPYVHFHEISSPENDTTKDSPGILEILVTLMCYSKQKGMKECNDLMDAVLDVLTATTVDLTGDSFTSQSQELADASIRRVTGRGDELLNEGTVRVLFRVSDTT